jgi:hypothetical protein
MPGGRTRPDGAAPPLSGDPEQQAADIRAYAEAGLDELMLSLPARSLADLIGQLKDFARSVIPRV